MKGYNVKTYGERWSPYYDEVDEAIIDLLSRHAGQPPRARLAGLALVDRFSWYDLRAIHRAVHQSHVYLRQTRVEVYAVSSTGCSEASCSAIWACTSSMSISFT